MFIETLDERFYYLNGKGYEVLLIEDVNVDLNSTAPLSYTSEYLQMLLSNAFSNLVTKPTRVSKTLLTIIGHIPSNDSESIITPQVLLYKISDHFPIICTIENPKCKAPKPETFIFSDLKTINVLKFCNDLKTILILLVCDFLNSNSMRNTFNEHMNKLVQAIYSIIEKRTPLKKRTRKQKHL